MQMNQLSQQSMMNSSLHQLRAPNHSHLYGGHTTSLLSYNFDISDIDAIDQNPQAVVTMVITLQESHETEIRELVKLCRETGLFSKTGRIFLRFDKEHSRRITNYCKLNCENVEVFSANEQSIFEFLQVRGQTINGREDASEDEQKYVLCVDFTRLKKNNETFDLLLRHTIGEWKYCLQLFHNDDAIRGVGLFPVPEDLSKDSDFWYDTFWLKVQPRTTLTRLQKKEKLELLYASKATWFSSESQIEDTTFLYDLSSTASLIQKGASTSDSNIKSMTTSTSPTTEHVRQLPSSTGSVSIRRQKALRSGPTMSIRRAPVDSAVSPVGPVETTTVPVVPETLVVQAQTFEKVTSAPQENASSVDDTV